jgi:hypothetical protein
MSPTFKNMSVVATALVAPIAAAAAIAPTSKWCPTLTVLPSLVSLMNSPVFEVDSKPPTGAPATGRILIPIPFADNDARHRYRNVSPVGVIPPA